MLNKLALKIGLLFFVFIVSIELFLFSTLYFTFVNERVDEVMSNLLARGNTHSEVLEDSFNETTLSHVAMMESSSDFIVIITDETGEELTHSDTVEPEMREVLGHTDIEEIPEQGEILEDNWQDERFIATDSPITIGGQHQGHVLMFAETSQIKEMVERMRNQFILGGLISIVLTVITIFLLSRLITLPLIRIKKATEQLGKGQGEVALDIERNDELGELANAITRLSTDLDRLKQERNDFLASISHELRTPLTYMKGYADIASRPGLSEEERQEYLAIIREETGHLTGLIKQLFELAQLDHNQFSIQREQVPIDALCHSVSSLVRPAFDEKNISITVECDPGLIAWVDPARFQQVLLNILDNARKHSEPDTTVSLWARRDKESIVISVTDQGEGIPQEDLPFVFDRLYRVDKSRSRMSGGSGLGLAIAKELVESHGGRISIDSTPNDGTTVTILLERGESHAENPIG
ncbi:ATP-binding protein [Planococcus sp. SIMBA_160]